MSDTDGLSARITALRERLEQAQGLLREAAAALPATQAVDLADQLERDVYAGARVQSLLDGSLRQIAGALNGEDRIRPTHLTGRARQLLERGRKMVLDLRRLADDPALAIDDADDPLVQGVRRVSAMVESAVRFIQAFPDAPSGQLRLCDGLEGVMDVVAERIGAITAAAGQRQLDRDRIETLAHWLCAIHDGRKTAIDPLVALAEAIMSDARDGAPLRFLSAGSPAGAQWLPRHAAAHGLTTAQVVARLLRQEGDVRLAPETAVLAALVHDVGMLAVPVDVLAQPGPLADEEKRIVERHPHAAAQSLAALFADVVGLTESVAGHHERLDGSGYPAGLTGMAIAPGARLLAVADVYAALAAPRPYRPAADPRTALTDTLMEAERGSLDRAAAERLLLLAFYPVGTVVELSDGSVARVVAVHPPRADVHAPARPVVQRLVDARGAILPFPETIDLSQCAGRAIVRAVPVAQRRRLLTNRYPEWAA
jgi:HD-GYP domain-containing protein (c-di-GMP phosphodiesterase class II)